MSGIGAETALIHNAGLWPVPRELGPEGLERAFVVNCAGPWTMQAPLLEAGLRRVFVVGAGLMTKGQFAPERTPIGGDFSTFRTYCTTKLCFAVAMRQLGRSDPGLDIAVVHPGVIRTDLGARDGLVGWLLRRVKRGWEAPEDCALRLAAQIDASVWSRPGEPGWWDESRPAAWPEAADDPIMAEQLLRTLDRLRVDPR